MPLIKTVLESALEAKIRALEPKLYAAFTAKTTGLYKAQVLIDQSLSGASPTSGFEQLKYKNDLWTKVAKEWGKVISKEVIKIIAEDVADIVATEMTSYIKSATIISPAGQITTPAAIGAPSTTTTPAGPSTIT